MKKMVIAAMVAMLAAGATAHAEKVENPKKLTKAIVKAGEKSEEIEITYSDPEDCMGEPRDEGGMKKTPVATAKNIEISGTTGTFDIGFTGLEISNIEFEDEEMAGIFGLEAGQQATLFCIDQYAENTSDDTLTIYMGQTEIVSNTKEQAQQNMWVSDYMESEYKGKVRQEGAAYFVLEKTDANDIESIKMYIDGPLDEAWDQVGEDVEIDFIFE